MNINPEDRDLLLKQSDYEFELIYVFGGKNHGKASLTKSFMLLFCMSLFVSSVIFNNHK